MQHTFPRRFWFSLDSYARKHFLSIMEKPNYKARVCDQNASIRRMLDTAQRDGKVGLVVSGMDCDCTQYYRERVIDAFGSVAEFKRWDEQRVDALDGPETIWLVPPEDVVPQHRSADLALMAYVDGHPSRVVPLAVHDMPLVS